MFRFLLSLLLFVSWVMQGGDRRKKHEWVKKDASSMIEEKKLGVPICQPVVPSTLELERKCYDFFLQHFSRKVFDLHWRPMHNAAVPYLVFREPIAPRAHDPYIELTYRAHPTKKNVIIVTQFLAGEYHQKNLGDTCLEKLMNLKWQERKNPILLLEFRSLREALLDVGYKRDSEGLFLSSMVRACYSEDDLKREEARMIASLAQRFMVLNKFLKS